MVFKPSDTKGRCISFAIKVFIFIALVIILDFSIGKLLRYYYYTQNSGWLYRTTYSLEKTNAELLVFGSSTANHHYYPRLFEQGLKMSFYNTGRDGNAIFYHYAILQGVLERYTPKIIILDFNYGEFLNNQEGYDRIASLLPYYDNHPEIRRIILLKGPYEKYKMLSKIYPFNSLLFQIGAGNASFNKTRENRNDEKGYVPLRRTLKESVTRGNDPVKTSIDSNRIKYFQMFIKDCISRNIRLYIFVSPHFGKPTHKDLSVSLGKEIAAGYNIPFFDFTDSLQFVKNPALYADESHLNDFGARIYSSEVIALLQSQGKENSSIAISH